MMFNKKQEPRCGYCLHGRYMKSMDKIVCLKAGTVDEWDSCRHFKYDPIKREPEQREAFKKPELDEKTFEL